MSDALVRNQPPSVDPGPLRLAVVGESPGIEEQHWATCASGHGFSTRHWLNRSLVARDRCAVCGTRDWKPSPKPFVGESGRLLNDLLAECGLTRERVYVGNCSRFPLSEGEKRVENCTGSLAVLNMELEEFRPNCVLVLGNLALHAFHPRAEEAKIGDWRGSIFEGKVSGSLGPTFKCVAALHPAAVLREPSQLALLRKDVQRAVDDAKDAALDLPEVVVDAPASAEEVCAKLKTIRDARLPVGFDIEGGCDVGVTVLSFATSPTRTLSIPFKRLNWSSVWSKDDELGIQMDARAVLEDAAVPKICHNSAYEMFCLAWLHGVTMVNVEDTMIAWAALLPELERGLDTVASLLTRQPHWGKAGDWATDEERDTYNAIDSCVTLECWQNMQPLFSAEQRAYYETQRSLLEPVVAMMLRGFRFDAEARDDMRYTIGKEVLALSGELDELAGIPLPSFREVAETVAMKVKLPQVVDWPDIVRFAKPSYREGL